MVKGACADDLAALALRRSPVGYVKDRRDPLLRGYSLEHEANDQINDARILLGLYPKENEVGIWGHAQKTWTRA
jgi:hypothetical protein